MPADHSTGTWAVRVPASSANMGPGFDVLGVALTLHAFIGVQSGQEDAQQLPARARTLEASHPASVAYAAMGGTHQLWAVAPIPAARGLGFSGAMRVGGAAAGLVERDGPQALESAAGRAEVLTCAVELERHGDNAAASLLGGVVAAIDSDAIPIPLGFDPDIAVWIPDGVTTATNKSRAVLSPDVPRSDAVFNIARTAVLVAALGAGDVAALRLATQDRLHQPTRLNALPETAAALDAALDAGADAAWLSGSGPTVAALCAGGQVEAVRMAWEQQADRNQWSGHAKQLEIDLEGTQVVDVGATDELRVATLG